MMSKVIFIFPRDFLMISKVYLGLDGIPHQSRGAGHDIVGYIWERLLGR